jgi:leucyl-tRNA synthetase
MSKSKGNGIVPETVADKYGVDVVRMYLMFMGPFDGTMAWNEKTLMGVKRFLDRFERFVISQIDNVSASAIDNRVLINKLIKGVGDDIEQFGFNTAIAKQMEAINNLETVTKDELKVLIRLLAPLAPYMAEELWQRLGMEASVHVSKWPKYDEKYLIDDKVTIAVAVNGKVRSEIEVDSQTKDDQQKILEIAKGDKKIREWIDSKEVIREIYIPGKMVNLVIK